jgi:hypothetical protein
VPRARDPAVTTDAERQRLAEGRAGRWDRWAPYLAERQWGTVREDYTPNGNAWNAFSHDQARSRAYRWGEDGLLGISDAYARLCFALTLWNGHDPILKERLFGLTGPEGNHGEDVKEVYFYLDATPTHSYLKALYKYLQRPFPYAELVAENRRRSREQPEFELLDTDAFAEDRYFDVLVEYAKAAADDILIRISATNRGPNPATLHLLLTLWFRNEWAWGTFDDRPRPSLRAVHPPPIATGRVPSGWRQGVRAVIATHDRLGDYWLACADDPPLLFTENESNAERLWGSPNGTPYLKDAFHDAIVHGRPDATNPTGVGTKVAAHYIADLAPAETVTRWLRLAAGAEPSLHAPFADAEAIMAQRIAEADAFYAPLSAELDDEAQVIQRQAYAGLIWSKQFYFFDVGEWLDGDPAGPPPPASRKHGRNAGWRHLNNADVLSMPDTWEYPWYAAWDLAFHCLPFARIDPEFAKRQLVLLLRE